MDILKKIFGKKEAETRMESKKARDDARRERIKTPSPSKTSNIDKIKSQKAQNAKKAPKGKAERAAQKAAQKSAQKTARKAVKRR